MLTMLPSKNHHVLRFAKKGNPVPEFKIKIVKDETMDRYTLKYRKKVILRERNVFISPLEMQISIQLIPGFKKKKILMMQYSYTN